MSQFILGKTISLDSSTLAKLSFDYFSNNRNNRDSARNIIKFFIDNALYLLITWHHIVELLQIEDNKKVMDRLNFLENFPVVVWSTSYDKNDNPGSIRDVLTLEVNTILETPSLTRLDVINNVKEKLFIYGTGKELVESHREQWLFMRPLLTDQCKRRITIASIDHSEIHDKKQH